jgi:hypothetical protein
MLISIDFMQIRNNFLSFLDVKIHEERKLRFSKEKKNYFITFHIHKQKN